MNTESAAYRYLRILKRMDRFNPSNAGDAPRSFSNLINSNEVSLGIYHGEIQAEDFIVTDKSVIFLPIGADQPVRISYIDIIDIITPLPASECIELRFKLRDNSLQPMKVVGIKGKFRDVFEVGRYFMRVTKLN